jgi:hypothetical protein
MRGLESRAKLRIDPATAAVKNSEFDSTIVQSFRAIEYAGTRFGFTPAIYARQRIPAAFWRTADLPGSSCGTRSAEIPYNRK